MSTNARVNRLGAPRNAQEWGAVLRTAALTLGRVVLLTLVVLMLGRVRSESSILILTAFVATCLTMVYFAVGAQFRVWALYVVTFVAFAQLRAHADNIGTPVQYDYPIIAERILFLGTLPVNWLQDAFYTYRVVGPLETYTTVVYLSYFMVPHIVAVALFLSNKRQFTRYVLAFMTTLYIALIVHAILPTAPPWLAAQEGRIPAVYQIVSDLTETVAPGSYEQGYALAGANDVAAMPSLHAGIPWLITIALWRYPVWRWLALGYAASMSFAIVYLGEHYFVDGLAGLAVAAISWNIAARIQARFGGTPEPEQATALESIAPPRGAIPATAAD